MRLEIKASCTGKTGGAGRALLRILKPIRGLQIESLTLFSGFLF